MFKRITLCFLIFHVVLAAQPALSQPGARVMLRAGATVEHSGTYEGEVPASTLVPGCPGFVSALPQLILEVEQAGWVQLAVESETGATPVLMIRSETDNICSDEATSGTGTLRLTGALRAGQYYIHVGARSIGESGEFTVRVRQRNRAQAGQALDDLGVSLLGTSGGDVSASTIEVGCLGTVSEAANHTLNLRRQSRLSIRATSQSDLTLIVQSGGETYCNDDARGTLDPGISGVFGPGPIDIYVGSHNPRVHAPYSLTVMPIAQQ